MKFRNRHVQRELFQDDRKMSNTEFIEYCRIVGRKLAKKRGVVSTDDIREEVEIPDWINPSVLGQVFRSPDFKHRGTKRRLYNKGGGGYVEVWALRQAR